MTVLHAEAYRAGWLDAAETILRDVEELWHPADGRWVDRAAVLGILSDAFEAIGERVPERPDRRPTMAEMDR